MHTKPKSPDFDTLMHLYQQDPKGYEILRRQLLDEAIAACPVEHRQKMQYVMMRIEIARKAASTPLESLAYATHLVRESLEELGNKLEELQYELTAMQSLLVLERIRSYSHPPQSSSSA